MTSELQSDRSKRKIGDLPDPQRKKIPARHAKVSDKDPSTVWCRSEELTELKYTCKRQSGCCRAAGLQWGTIMAQHMRHTGNSGPTYAGQPG